MKALSIENDIALLENEIERRKSANIPQLMTQISSNKVYEVHNSNSDQYGYRGVQKVHNSNSDQLQNLGVEKLKE